jgi:DNA-binding GntR family transcriptional regulator
MPHGHVLAITPGHRCRPTFGTRQAFHSAIVALRDSSRLDEFYAELTQELRFYLMVLSVDDHEFESPGVVLAEHEAILSAIRSRHADRAVRQVRVHIETNAQHLKEILAERE